MQKLGKHNIIKYNIRITLERIRAYNSNTRVKERLVNNASLKLGNRLGKTLGGVRVNY